MMRPRDYQLWGVDAFWNYFANGGTGNPIAAYPTGTGKSLIIAFFIQRVMHQFPNQRILVLTHVKELIKQNHSKLVDVWPSAPVGIYSAGLRKRELNFPITFAGIASVHKLANEFGHIDLIMIDECHLVSERSNSMYLSFINKLKEINPHLKVLGLTATAYRTNDGSLINKKGLFTDVCIDMTHLQGFNWFLDNGYLAPLIPRATTEGLDVSNVDIKGGEFVANQLQNAVDRSDITEPVVDEIIQLAEDRRSWLVFASGIEHAEHISALLNQKGVSSVCVHSGNSVFKMNTKQRDANIKAFTDNKVRAIVNNGVLTTGFDHPQIDLIAMLRPTMSAGLWCQMLGRGTRPVYAPNHDLSTTEGRLEAMFNGTKQDCLVLDFARNTPRLGPINNVIQPTRRSASGGGGVRMPPPAIRICSNCRNYVDTLPRQCAICGYTEPYADLDDAASLDALIVEVEQPIIETFKVDSIIYSSHQRIDRPPSMQVMYVCGLRTFKEFVCFEHAGTAQNFAREWWRLRGGLNPEPDTILNALERVQNETAIPYFLKVHVNRRYPEILEHCFAGDNFGTDATLPIRQPNVLTQDKTQNKNESNNVEFIDDDIPF